MNKKKIDQMIPQAYKKLDQLSKEGKLEKAYRSHVASFGAAMATGSMLAAVSNFVADDLNSEAKDKQGKAMGIYMWEMLKENYSENNKELMDKSEDLLSYLMEIQNKGDVHLMNEVRSQLKEIAVSMKLAMNFFQLVDKSEKKKGEKNE